MWFLRHAMKFPAARRYATIASGKSLRGKKGPPLTLEHVGTLSIVRGLGEPMSDMFGSSCKEDEC